MAPFSDYLAGGVNDLRLKPRILRSLTRDLDDTGHSRSRLFAGENLDNILEKVQLHGLLTELLPEGYNGKDEAKLKEEWRLAVDACHKNAGLVHVCWVFPLKNAPQNSSLQPIPFGLRSYCKTFRLPRFPNVKKESTSFAGRLVLPILHLMDGDGSFVETAIDILCTLIKFYPSAIYRFYDKVESALASKIMSGKSNMEVLMKISGALALLPHMKGDSWSWYVIMQKLLISINLLLNDVFEGLEEEGKGPEIMKLLVPAGTEAPPLWDQKNKSEGNSHATRRLRNTISPLLFSLTYSCCIMLTNPYPVQVSIPVRPLLTLIGRVLNVDGTLVSKTVLPSTTSLYQELLCSEPPSFHLYILDLLIATIKGLKSQLLPHAASVLQPITDYFWRATLPSIRAKIYYTLELLLHSMGVGMSLYLAKYVVSNASMDLDESCESICISKLGNETSLKSSPKKRKRRRSSSQSDGVEQETSPVIAEKKLMPLSVKIAALRAMETLLSVGGSLKSESWRLEADRLLINVATESLDAFTGKAGKYLCMWESATSQERYRLAALQALLSSLLSPSHVRPPYLSQGLELFQKGKLETGTEVSTFCEKALLALEVLIHPRDIPLVNYPVPVVASVSINEYDDEEIYPGWWGASDDEKPPDVKNGDKQAQLIAVDARKPQDVEQKRREDNREAATSPIKHEKNESSGVSPHRLGLSHAEAMVDQLPSQELQNTGSVTRYAVSHNTVEDEHQLAATVNVLKNTVEDKQSEKLYSDLSGYNNSKGKELMIDSDSESLDSVPRIVDVDPETDSD